MEFNGIKNVHKICRQHSFLNKSLVLIFESSSIFFLVVITIAFVLFRIKKTLFCGSHLGEVEDPKFGWCCMDVIEKCFKANHVERLWFHLQLSFNTTPICKTLR